MAQDVVGIDVSKAKLAVVLLTATGKARHKSCLNTAAGHLELLGWLARYGQGAVHASLEATGPYGEAVALALHAAGHRVSVLNPSIIVAYAASQLTRTKTDATDAGVIARYTQTQQPPAWTPPPVERRQLQALVRRLEALHEMRVQEVNRLAALPEPVVRTSIEATLAHFDAQIAQLKTQIRDHFDQHPPLRQQRDLLTSIPGIGETTAAVLLGELLDVTRFQRARQVAAFSGVVPRLRQSGTSVPLRGRLSRLGPGRLRKALYFPALAALRCNPTVRTFAARLRAKGKPKMVIIAAVMRKLIHVVFGVLRSQRLYDPTHA
jgi:transposase